MSLEFTTRYWIEPDILLFGKMFGISIPVLDDEHFRHYIETLGRSVKYRHIPARALAYLQLEAGEAEGRVDNFRRWNRTLVTDRLWDIWEKMGHTDESVFDLLPDVPFQKADSFEGTAIHDRDSTAVYLSIDMKSANYSALKLLDQNDEFLPAMGPGIEVEWSEFLSSLDVHPFFSTSKGFRQVAFGKFKPKTLVGIEKRVIALLVSKLKEVIGWNQFVRVLHDEIVIHFPNSEEASQASASIRKVLDNFELPVRWHEKWFKMFPVNPSLTIRNGHELRSGRCVPKNRWFRQTKLDKANGSVVSESLYGVPSNMFYPLFRSEVLGEAVEEYDLHFSVDGQIASWRL